MKKDLQTLTKVKLTDVIPYWRNPRDNFDAIEKVKESISKFGYKNPIIVDKNMIIVAGHTRYEALKQLGYEEINVLIDEGMTEDEAKEYRLIDNKVAEYATWDEDKLKLELRDLLGDTDYMSIFFGDTLEAELESSFGAASESLDNYVETGRQATAQEVQEEYRNSIVDKVNVKKENQTKVTIICPKCFHEFFYQE